MIKERTAFIIGAGASKPYALPTGLELREMIINQRANSGYFFSLKVLGYSTSRFESFCDQFLLSGIQSIDHFLELRPEYLLEGKLAISFSIKQQEKKAVELTRKDEWLQFLFNKMVDGISDSSGYKEFYDNQVYFCTFNYDRLLEHYLATAFFHSFSANKDVQNLFDDRGMESVKSSFKFAIDHVYGSIGDLSSNPVEDQDESKVGSYFSDILLIQERSRAIGEIMSRLQLCHRYIFLGYGFNQENNQLLDLSSVCRGKPVYATGFGMFQEERNRIQKAIAEQMEIHDCTCYELLRRFL